MKCFECGKEVKPVKDLELDGYMCICECGNRFWRSKKEVKGEEVK